MRVLWGGVMRLFRSNALRVRDAAHRDIVRVMLSAAVVRSIALFAMAGLAEIGGGYLVWRSIRNGAGFWAAVAGAVLLVAYGVIPTFQPSAFGRTYAAYGGVFVVLSLLWGWIVDRVRPDAPDIIGALVCLVGVAIIMYWPRA